MTLGEALRTNVIKEFYPGMVLHLRHSDDTLVKVLIGDATPYHEPSTNDGGIGWMYDSPYGKMEYLGYNSVPSEDSFTFQPASKNS
jgi:hypothetical protein